MEGGTNVAMGVLGGDISRTSFADAITKKRKMNENMIELATILAL